MKRVGVWKAGIAAIVSGLAVLSASATAQDFDYKALKANPTPDKVGAILKRAASVGRGTHSFEMTYCTNEPGVVLPPDVRARFPVEITIVLEWQFSSLELKVDIVHVDVAFGGVPARLQIPLRTLTYFGDPSEKMSVQLRKGGSSAERCPAKAKTS